MKLLWNIFIGLIVVTNLWFAYVTFNTPVRTETHIYHHIIMERPRPSLDNFKGL